MIVELRTGRRPSLLMVVVLLAAAALFLGRGPWRAIRSGGGDLAAPYVSSLRFLQGKNPYTSNDFLADWRAAGAKPDSFQNSSGTRPIYPPSTLLLMAPFSAMRWGWALGVYESLCTVFYAYILLRLAQEIEPGWSSWARTGFVAYGLALAPVQTGLGVANLSVLTFLLGVECLLLGRARNDVSAGITLGLCCCLKPSVGAALLVYWLICRRWKLAGWGLSLIAVISGLAMWRMATLPRGWFADYRANTEYLFGPSGVANFTDANVLRFDLLNLQVPFYQLTHSIRWANALSWGLVLILTAVWLRLLLQRREVEKGWAAPAVLLLLGLMPIYQRNYNAGFVLLALIWAFQHLRGWVGRWILLCGGFFLLPGEALLRHFDGLLPGLVRGSFLLNFLIIPQANWALVAISVLLLFGMWREPIEGPTAKGEGATAWAGF